MKRKLSEDVMKFVVNNRHCVGAHNKTPTLAYFAIIVAALGFSLTLASDSWALTKSERIGAGKACLKACHDSGKNPKDMIRCEVGCCKTFKLLKPPSRCEAAAAVNPGQSNSPQGGGILEQ